MPKSAFVPHDPGSIETRTSWVVACAALAVMSVTYGAPLVAVVALKPIAADLGSERSVPSLAYSLAWLGAAFGGLAMGRIAERVGVRWTASFGALMIGLGLFVATGGSAWRLYVGYGLLIGLLGNGGINAPLYIYVSHWFDRRRGTALALISSGQYVAGTIWPPLFERSIAEFGWQRTMIWFGTLVAAAVLPLAMLLRRPPAIPVPAHSGRSSAVHSAVLGWRPGVVLGLLAFASFCCCVPMAMPQGHLVALCTDLGIPASHGAAMLSLLLGMAFISRQLWGWLSDRIGGLGTVLAASFCQATALAALTLTQSETGLFVVAAAFGLGFSGIIPAYVLAIRELFPAAEAAWRVPILLLCSGSGMAMGGWLAGAIYDHFGFYAPALATGVGFNLLNLAVIGTLVARQRRMGLRAAMA
ncbi:MAG TPA: MFS transporter [Stellaceae bacterium]|nr:MFS transporter [Stellaceae bacterium]